MTSEDLRRSSESTNRSTIGIDDEVFFDGRSSSSKSEERSPQREAIPAGDLSTRTSLAQDLFARLHREERARNTASALLAELDNEFPKSAQEGNQNQGLTTPFLPALKFDSISPKASPSSSKTSVIQSMRQLASLKINPDAQRKKLRAQFEFAEREISEIHRQMREEGFDEDDEISSGDEEAPSGVAASMILSDDYSIADDDLPPAGTNQLGMVMSATSSAADLTSSHSHSQMSPLRESASADLLAMNTSFYQGSLASQHSSRSSSTAFNVEVSLGNVMLMLEALDHRQPDVHTTVEKLCEFVQSTPGLKQELKIHGPRAMAAEKIKPFLLDKNSAIRCLGFRILRLMIVDINSLVYFRSYLSLDLQFVQVLSKDDHDKNHDLRLTVIQLIRVIINIPGGAKELSQSVYRALVAVSEQYNDGTRHICIETLAELLTIDPERVFEAGAVQLLLRTMINPDEGLEEGRPPNTPFSLALAMGFLDASDWPDIRHKYLRGGRDVSSLLTNFTDVQLYGFVSPSKELLETSASVMKVLMRSWVGIFIFNFSLFVECMIMPLESVQSTLLGVLDNVLWIPDSQDNLSTSAPSAQTATILMCQFTAILLRRLQRSGLQEKLVTLQNEGETEGIRQLAQQLGSRVFTLSARLIPSYDIVPKSMALSAKLAEDLTKNPTHSLPTTSVSLFGTEAKLKEAPALQTPKPGLETFIRFGMAIDDGSFKKLVNATHVLDTKLFRHWNWDALMELVQGPLRSPRRLDELTKGSKFLKRLLSFYRPFKYRFSNLPITKEHLRYVKVGKEMVKSLLETAEGFRYLSQNKLFRQIAECLAQLDPLSGIMSNEPLFSVRRFRTTLCGAYAEFIGVLSRSVAGQQILAQIRIFNMLYRVCDINREDVMRSFICALDYRIEGHPRLILAKALTASSRSTRLFATEFVGVRMAQREPAALWAVDLMVEQLYDIEIAIAKAAAVGLLNICSLSERALDYLISLRPFIDHLGEPAHDLQILFMSRPAGFELLMDQLEKKDIPRWAAELHDSYVDKIDAYLESETFPSKLKGSSKQTTEPFKFPTYARPDKHQTQGIEPPSHFYGELALTDEGCRFLKSKGLISELYSEIDTAVGISDWNPNELRRFSAVLWAIGHIASRPKGVLLLDVDLVRKICDICRDSEVYSLKGTTYYVLGLFAFSLSGAELLHQCGWDVVYDSFSRPMGVTLPPSAYDTPTEPQYRVQESDLAPRPKQMSKSPSKSPSKRRIPSTRSPVKSSSRSVKSQHTSEQETSDAEDLLRLDTTERRPSLILAPSISATSLATPKSPTSHNVFDFEIDPALSSRRSSFFDLLEFPPKRDETMEVIIHAVCQLGSSVLSQSATKRLVAMRASHPAVFQREDLAREVLDVLGSGNYRQVTRRFIFELLDIHTILEKIYRRNRLA